jgi:hypothetical protein
MGDAAGKTMAGSAEAEELHSDHVHHNSPEGHPDGKRHLQQQQQQQPLSTEQGLWTPPSRIALARMPDPSLSAASPERQQPPSALPTPAQALPPPHTHEDASSAKQQLTVRFKHGWRRSAGDARCVLPPYAHTGRMRSPQMRFEAPGVAASALVPFHSMLRLRGAV